MGICPDRKFDDGSNGRRRWRGHNANNDDSTGIRSNSRRNITRRIRQQPDNITITAGGAANSTMTTMTNGTSTEDEAPMIKMMPTEVNCTYRWAINDTINPTITLANVNNMITVDNPTDEVHELVIAMAQGEAEVASTRDIPPNGHGELSIMPNATESLQYHCQYHPQTMLGEIRITNATTTTNQTQ